MINLAGQSHDAVDSQCQAELWRARIPSIAGARSTGEVPTRIYGELAGIRFDRRWAYWAATGRVGLSCAQAMYEADDVLRSDVRAGGDCAARPPSLWATYRSKTSGKRLVSHVDANRIRGILGQDAAVAALVEFEEVEDDKDGDAFVEMYHIDTELGLRLFADWLWDGLGLEAIRDRQKRFRRVR